jgi:hypothetical protein
MPSCWRRGAGKLIEASSGTVVVATVISVFTLFGLLVWAR